mmetsp:Transcript_1337/g.4525  ORF Transcript_1337/g.4525 Transcript_1337/m.4525 type:complete len:415 (+) Transcript_1337:1664-2908(+)
MPERRLGVQPLLRHLRDRPGLDPGNNDDDDNCGEWRNPLMASGRHVSRPGRTCVRACALGRACAGARARLLLACLRACVRPCARACELRRSCPAHQSRTAVRVRAIARLRAEPLFTNGSSSSRPASNSAFRRSSILSSPPSRASLTALSLASIVLAWGMPTQWPNSMNLGLMQARHGATLLRESSSQPSVASPHLKLAVATGAHFKAQEKGTSRMVFPATCCMNLTGHWTQELETLVKFWMQASSGSHLMPPGVAIFFMSHCRGTRSSAYSLMASASFSFWACSNFGWYSLTSPFTCHSTACKSSGAQPAGTLTLAARAGCELVAALLPPSLWCLCGWDRLDARALMASESIFSVASWLLSRLLDSSETWTIASASLTSSLAAASSRRHAGRSLCESACILAGHQEENKWGKVR